MHDHDLMPLSKYLKIYDTAVIWTFITYQCFKVQIHGDNTSHVHIAQLAAKFCKL